MLIAVIETTYTLIYIGQNKITRLTNRYNTGLIKMANQTYNQIRNQVFTHLSNLTEGDDLIDSMLADKAIENRMIKGKQQTIEGIVDDYYKYRVIFLTSGPIDNDTINSIESGVPLHELTPILNDEIDRMYHKPGLEFVTIGVECHDCGSTDTSVELLQLGALDEAKIQRVTCNDCGYVSG